jgi:hypothetical protein
MPHNQIYRRSLREAERVSLHMNLNNGLLAVKSREANSYGQVIQHRKTPVTLARADFRVQESGLKRIREEEKRNVCAYVLGRVTFSGADSVGRPVRFNPFERDRFHYADGNRSTVASAPLLRAWIEETESGRRPRMQAIDFNGH